MAVDLLSTRQASADDRSKFNKICIKKKRIVEFYDHIWNHNEKRIQISTNMPGIGSLIPEIDVDISEI